MELPNWLLVRFERPTSRAEKVAWLQERRSSPPEQKIEVERVKGWEMAQWLYWFSDENETWSVVSVEPVLPSGILVQVEHVDDPCPMESLEWLADGCEISVTRIE